MTDRQAHWDATYTTKSEAEVSWYQASPARSLAFIRSAAPDRAASIIDVGGGASNLVDALLADGYRDLTVLDISAVALARTKVRLDEKSQAVSWVVADITQWRPRRTWSVWHDRAVFHFLTDCASQDGYLSALDLATVPGSSVIMATFALSGPERCSGLPVQRYSAQTLSARLGAKFRLYDEAEETHATPFGTTQAFSFAAFRKL